MFLCKLTAGIPSLHPSPMTGPRAPSFPTCHSTIGNDHLTSSCRPCPRKPCTSAQMLWEVGHLESTYRLWVSTGIPGCLLTNAPSSFHTFHSVRSMRMVHATNTLHCGSVHKSLSFSAGNLMVMRPNTWGADSAVPTSAQSIAGCLAFPPGSVFSALSVSFHFVLTKTSEQCSRTVNLSGNVRVGKK